MDWASVTHAGAFIGGLTIGILTTLRVARAVFILVKKERPNARGQVHEEGDDNEG